MRGRTPLCVLVAVLMPAVYALVPSPVSVSFDASASVQVSAQLSLAGPSASVPTLQAAFIRLMTSVLPQYRSAFSSAGCAGPLLTTLSVSAANSSEAHPQLGDDESYTLTLATPSIIVTCARLTGCLHAMSTLAQVVAFDFDSGCYSLASGLSVSDAPRFPTVAYSWTRAATSMTCPPFCSCSTPWQP